MILSISNFFSAEEKEEGQKGSDIHWEVEEDGKINGVRDQQVAGQINGEKRDAGEAEDKRIDDETGDEISFVHWQYSLFK